MTRLAIISDVHAFKQSAGHQLGSPGDPSWVRTQPDKDDTRHGPFKTLLDLIEREGLAADYLLCPGDMGDKADRDGISFTWGWIETIRRRLFADMSLATTGNHDVDSHNLWGISDPTNAVRGLNPPFPLDDPPRRDEYFGRHFTIVEQGDFAIVLLNTCADHADPIRAERGCISDATLEDLRKELATLTATTRVILCHHHPFRHDAIDRADYSAADGGPELLKLLEDNGDWMVIHGHRHYPNLVYSSGSAAAPVILAAGSFSAMLYPDLMTRVRNQFLIVELDGPEPISGTAGLCGRVRAWEYNRARGWVAPQSAEGIPDGAAFGYRGSLQHAVDEVAGQMTAQIEVGEFLTLGDLFDALPHLQYLIPRDRSHLLSMLGDQGLAKISPNEHFAVPAAEIFVKREV